MKLVFSLAGLVLVPPLVAQIDQTANGWLTFMVREGVAVGVLVLLLLRIEPRLSALERSFDRQARAAFQLLVEHSRNEVVREDAKRQIGEIDAKQNRT